MSEVFSGTPAIVNVTIIDQEGKQVAYHVAGQDLRAVQDAVRAALQSLPEESSPAGKRKKFRKRRTKAEMAALEVIDAIPVQKKEKAWA